MNDFDKVVRLWKRAGLTLRPGDERPQIKRKLERDPELFLVAEQKAHSSQPYWDLGMDAEAGHTTSPLSAPNNALE